MKLDKKTRKIIDQMVKISFDKAGRLDGAQARKNAELLAALPRWSAIASMSEYLHRIKSEVGKTTLLIESPLSLAAPQQQKIRQSFSDKYLVNDVQTVVDSSLFGGVRVKLGDMVFDDSIRNRINQLKGAIKG